MTTPKPEPASDADVEEIKRTEFWKKNPSRVVCPAEPMVLRIEADRARIGELEEMYGELQDWVGEQMTPPDVVEDALVRIVAKAEHFIPPYAYGDNEAACEFASLLEQIHSIARAALSKPEPGR